MRCIRNENFAFPLLKNNRVRPRSVIRAEKGQHAARLPFFHAVGVKTLGIRRVQPGIMNLFFRYPRFNELCLNGRRNVFFIMRRADAGGNDGNQVGRFHPKAFFHGLDGVGNDVAGGSRLA